MLLLLRNLLALWLLLAPAAPLLAHAAPTHLLQAPPGPVAATVSPNPVAATAELRYEVLRPGPVLVELLNGRGSTLRTVATLARQEKGLHTLPVSLSELPAGVYYYNITTRAGAQACRFVKE